MHGWCRLPEHSRNRVIFWQVRQRGIQTDIGCPDFHEARCTAWVKIDCGFRPYLKDGNSNCWTPVNNGMFAEQDDFAWSGRIISGHLLFTHSWYALTRRQIEYDYDSQTPQ